MRRKAYDSAIEEIDGWMSPEELRWLHEQASEYASVVEIGCWKGRSTAALSLGCSGQVWTVDHFGGSPSELDGAHGEARHADIFAQAQTNLVAFANVRILNMTSLKASRCFSEYSVDMVFIDGEHTFDAVLLDLVAWGRKFRRLLCGHDRDMEGVQKALAVYGVPVSEGPGSIWHCERLA